jgi:DNA-binding GntR family transcriptional regulator
MRSASPQTRYPSGSAARGKAAGAAPRPGARTPRYLSVARLLQAEIRSGALPVGAGLPTEAALASRFRVSRHSIREALRQLREAGLVSSRQGSGSRVAAPGAPGRFVHAVASLRELSDYAQSSQLRLTEQKIVTVDGPTAARLDCSPKRRWLRITGLRHLKADATPAAWVEVFVHLAYAGIRTALKGHRGSIFELIERHGGERIVEVTQTIRTTEMSAPVAAMLGWPAGAPAIEIARVYRNSRHKIVEVAFTVEPAHQFSYSIRLRQEAPESGRAL